MIILMTAALAAAQPAPAPSATMPADARHQQMEHKGAMSHMGHMRMSEEQMAECRRRCEHMMAMMHHGHKQHQGHAG